MTLKKTNHLESVFILRQTENRQKDNSVIKVIFRRFLNSSIAIICLSLISATSIAEVVDIEINPETSSVQTMSSINSSTHEDIWNSALAIIKSSNDFPLQSPELTSLITLLDEVALEKVEILNDQFLMSNFIFDYQLVEKGSLFSALAFGTDNSSNTPDIVNTISSRLLHRQRLQQMQHMQKQHLQQIRQYKR